MQKNINKKHEDYFTRNKFRITNYMTQSEVVPL